MTQGTDPNDVYHNGAWYSRDGTGGPVQTITDASGNLVLIGGTGVTSILKLQGTSGNGTLTSPAVQALVGNNGATTAVTVLNNGNVGIGTTSPDHILNPIITNNTVGNYYPLSVRFDRNTTSSSNRGVGISFSETENNIGQSTMAGIVGIRENSVSNWLGALAFLVNKTNSSNGSAGESALTEVMRINGSGNVGIGTTTPSGFLHLKAGAAAVSSAPLKFTTGVLQTTSEAGAYEFAGDLYYQTITTSATRRVQVAAQSGRSVGATAAVASVVTFTLGAADASFEVCANVLVTTATTHSFNVTLDYTDEGNTARSVTLNFSTLAGVISNAAITNVGGAVPYEGVPIHIRCKASTAITVATAGTFTAVVYSVEATIKQIA